MRRLTMFGLVLATAASIAACSNSATGLMAGFGGEYGVTRNIALTADIDYFGKLSQQAKGGLLSVSLRVSF